MRGPWTLVHPGLSYTRGFDGLALHGPMNITKQANAIGITIPVLFYVPDEMDFSARRPTFTHEGQNLGHTPGQCPICSWAMSKARAEREARAERASQRQRAATVRKNAEAKRKAAADANRRSGVAHRHVTRGCHGIWSTANSTLGSWSGCSVPASHRE